MPILEKELPHNTRDAGLYSCYRLNQQVGGDELLQLIRRQPEAQRGYDDDCRQLQAEAWEIWVRQAEQLTRIWQDTGCWPDQLEAQVLADRDRRLAQVESAAEFGLWERILRGDLGRRLITAGPQAWNTVTNAYLISTEGLRLCNQHTNNEDGILRYLAVGTNAVPSAGSDTALGRETYRAEPRQRRNTTSGSKIILEIPFTAANLTYAGTVAAGSWDALHFDVDDATGLNVGDAILVGTSPAQSTTRIQAISGNSLTLAPAEPLLSVPVGGESVSLQLGEFGGFGNGLATSTANTGTLFSRTANPTARLDKFEDISWYIKYQYIRLAL